MILVDSSVWIDFFNGRTASHTGNLALLLDDMAPVAVADLVLFEVLRGFRHERDYLAARKTMTALTVIAIGGEDNALQAAQHDRLLRAMGYTIRRAVDVLQASYCIDHDYALLHNDTDFDVMENLRGLRVWRH
ncbi:MAG: VapC toxin family PIN domain ribonuclease [Thiomonas sp. 20-64-5]|nr:MAG: VapC toxin family PIN domain ribonuclease [Thiomonas sp. 20-64-5]